MAIPRFPPAVPGQPCSLAAAAARWNEIVEYLETHPLGDVDVHPGAGLLMSGSAIDAVVLLGLAQVATMVETSTRTILAERAGALANTLVKFLGRANPQFADVGGIEVVSTPPLAVVRSGPCEDPTCPACREQREGHVADPSTRH